VRSFVDRQSNLDKHLKYHEGEHEFHCILCGIGFDHERLRPQHYVTAHGFEEEDAKLLLLEVGEVVYKFYLDPSPPAE